MEIKKECNVCSKAEGQLLLCGRCKLVWYCSVDCQRKDWKEHKKLCGDQPVKKEEPKPDEPHSRADDFIHIAKCGVGNFSEIWKVESKEDRSKVYALKIVNKKRVTANHKEKDILMEKHCLKVLEDCEHVIKLYETFKDELNVYFLMEYMEGGELWDHLKTFGLVADSLIKYYYCHLLKAVQSIHAKGIVHRDLKPENIMLDSKKKMKLVDFGTARDMNNPEIKGSGNSAKGKKIFDHFVGTPQYMAPECIHNKDSNFKCDIWSLGCILYQFLAGYPPFNGGSEYIIFMKSTSEKPIFYDYLFSAEAKDLITKMLEPNMEKRLSLEEVMKHPYFEGVDFDNLPTYEEAQAKITPFEAFLINLKDKYLAFKSQDQPEKAKEHVNKVLNEATESIEKQPDFTNNEKGTLLVRVKLMKEQALGYYGVEDFEWEGMKKDFFSHIKRPQPESSDEENDSDD